MRHKLNSLLGLAVILLAALACNYSFTTANIGSLKVSKYKNAAMETSVFEPRDAVYVVAQISNTSDQHKVTSRVLYEDVQGQASGKLVPGADTTIDVPGAAAATFTLAPSSSGWEPGRYKVEVTLKNEDGKLLDQKTTVFTVEGESTSQETTETPAANTNSASTSTDSARLADVKLTADNSSEPERSQDTFAPNDFIYVMYTMENVPRRAAVYCNMYMDNGDKTPLRSLSYMNPPEPKFAERFDLDPEVGWADGTHLIELSYRANPDAEPTVLKTLKVNIR
jgi:hypothetical protein